MCGTDTLLVRLISVISNFVCLWFAYTIFSDILSKSHYAVWLLILSQRVVNWRAVEGNFRGVVSDAVLSRAKGLYRFLVRFKATELRYLLGYWLQDGAWVVNKFLGLCGSWRFVTVLTKARLSPSWGTWTYLTSSHTIYLICALIISYIYAKDFQKSPFFHVSPSEMYVIMCKGFGVVTRRQSW